MGINLNDFESHPGKLLKVHLENVSEATKLKTQFRAAVIAALFHDLGKINPNFQQKLAPNKVKGYFGYSGHAYLSALAWLCFCQNNRELVKNLIGDDPITVFSVSAMIAHHHGHLPNMMDRIFYESESDKLKMFIGQKPYLPISDFLQMLLPHKSFSVHLQERVLESLLSKTRLSSEHMKEVKEPLSFFLETQFGFACFIESDKRDASGNNDFNKQRLSPYFQENFSPRVQKKLTSFSATEPKLIALNQVRSQMREEAVEAIQKELADKKRIFTLSAPTGSGKTLMMLSLAGEILKQNPGFGIIYALPFLSITEQVTDVCQDIFSDNKDAVLRIDSRAENNRIDKLQERLDDSDSETEEQKDLLKDLLKENFSQLTFDYPFIITTFVQVFETLVSNRNSTLLKLPNFAKSVFLIDEIQALPPRLYIFFTALLDEFCRRFNSYAIISTATMPYLKLSDKGLPDNDNPTKLFVSYSCPRELLSGEKHYSKPEFNRYQITKIGGENFLITDLADEIRRQNKSCLIILNTISDTKQLYQLLSKENSESEFDDREEGENDENDIYVLLNTHFTLNDRREKLATCKEKLKKGEQVILISTQLIEAGVDVDFPIVYRDFCPLPNLIQAAGRCNRNGLIDCGQVYFFELKGEDGKSRASLIYQGKDKILLDFAITRLPNTIDEAGLFELQKGYFEFIGQNLSVGKHEQYKKEINMIECINQAKFAELGQFKLIDDSYYGIEAQYYIPESEEDDNFEQLQQIYEDMPSSRNYEDVKKWQLGLEKQYRKMTNHIVTVRVLKEKQEYLPEFSDHITKRKKEIDGVGLRKLSRLKDYSSKMGLRLDKMTSSII